MFKQLYKISVRASKETIKSLLINDEYFTCYLSENNFSLAEKLFFSNKFLHPIAKGQLCCSQKDSITVGLDMELRPADKLFFLIDILISFVIAAFSVICTHTIEIAVIIVSFLIANILIFLLVYKYNCKRFYKKIVTLLNYL